MVSLSQEFEFLNLSHLSTIVIKLPTRIFLRILVKFRKANPAESFFTRGAPHMLTSLFMLNNLIAINT